MAKYQKCGKPNCWCAQEGQKGHGPYYHLVRYFSAILPQTRGKYVWRYLSKNPEVAKQKAERIMGDPIEIQEKIPVPRRLRNKPAYAPTEKFQIGKKNYSMKGVG